jgi:hypothetical protein
MKIQPNADVKLTKLRNISLESCLLRLVSN